MANHRLDPLLQPTSLADDMDFALEQPTTRVIALFMETGARSQGIRRRPHGCGPLRHPGCNRWRSAPGGRIFPEYPRIAAVAAEASGKPIATVCSGS